MNQQNFDSWYTSLKLSIDYNSNYLSFLPQVNSFLYEIIASSSCTDLPTSFQQFLHDDYPQLINKISQLNSVQNQYEDSIKEFYNASLLLSVWAIQNEKLFLINHIPIILNPQNGISHQTQIYDEVFSFFLETEIANSIFNNLKNHPDFENLKLSLQILSYILIYCQNKPDKLSIELETFMFTALFDAFDKFFSQLHSDQILRTFDDNCLDDIISKLLAVLYYYDENKFQSPMNFDPILDFAFFLTQSKVLKLQILGMRFFSNIFSSKNLMNTLLAWPKLDSLFHFLVYSKNLHVELIKRASSILCLVLKDNPRIEVIDELYKRAILVHEADREQNFILIANLLLIYDEKQVIEFISNKQCDPFLIMFLVDSLSYLNPLKEELSESLFKILFDKRNQTFKNYSVSLSVKEILIKFAQSLVSFDFRLFMINYCLSYLDEDFVINFLLNLISHYPLINQFCDETILTVLIISINQNRKGVFDVISLFHTQFQIPIEEDEILQILDGSIEKVDDYFWDFLFKQLQNLGTKAFSESAYNYMLQLIKQEIAITDKFIEFLRYFILVINYKHRILISDQYSVDTYNLIPKEHFYFIKLPILGFDIVWNYYLKSNNQQVCKYLEESILLFGTQIRGISIEQVFSSFYSLVGPVVTFPFSTIEMKSKALYILDKFIHVIEKDDDNFEYGFLRHFQEDFDFRKENKLTLYSLNGCGFDGFHMYFKTPIDRQIVSDTIKKYFFYDFTFDINENQINIQCNLDFPMNHIVIPKIPSLFLSEQNFSSFLLLLISTNPVIEGLCWRLLSFMPTDPKARLSVKNPDIFFSIINERKCLRELLYYLQIFKLNDSFVSLNGIQALIDLYNNSDALIRKEILRILFNLDNNDSININHIKEKYLRQCIEFLFMNLLENRSVKLAILHLLIYKTDVQGCLGEIVNGNVDYVLDFIKETNEFDDCLLLIQLIQNPLVLLDRIIDQIETFLNSKSSAFYHIIQYLFNEHRNIYDFSFIQNKSIDFIMKSIEFITKGYFSNETVTKNNEDFSVIQNQQIDVDLFSHFCTILGMIDSTINAFIILKAAFSMPNARLNSSLISLYMKLSKDTEVDQKCHDFLLKLFIDYDLYSVSTIDFGEDFRGLKNSGTLCFANSILQQLYYIQEFRQNILFSQVELELQKVFAELGMSSQNCIDATPFYQTFGELNIDMQQDAVEFLTLFLDRLPPDVKLVFKGEIENSLIRVGTHDTIPTSRSIEPFYVFPLSITESITNNNNHIFEQTEAISDYYSDELKEKFDVLKRTKLTTLPQVLILHLKRFEFDMNTFTRFKLNKSVQFPENLSIADSHFELIGIVCHYGIAEMGHYTSIVKNFSDNEFPWICFNDICVTKLIELPTDVNLSAYILFYSQIQNPKKELIIRKNLVETINSENINFLNKKQLFSTSCFDLIMISPHFDIQINYFFKIMKTKQITSLHFLNELEEKFHINQNEDYFVSFIEKNFDHIKTIFSKNHDEVFSSMIYLSLLVEGDKMYDFCSRLFELPMNFHISLFLDKVFSSENTLLLLRAIENNWIHTIYSITNENTDSYNVEFLLNLLLRLDHLDQSLNDNNQLIYSFESKLLPLKTNTNNMFSLINADHFLSFLISVFPRTSICLNDLVSYIKPTVNNVKYLISLLNKLQKVSEYTIVLNVLKKIKENQYIDDLLALLKDEAKYPLISNAMLNQFNLILIIITNINQDIREKGNELLHVIDKNGENLEIAKQIVVSLVDAFSNSEYSRMLNGLNYIEEKIEHLEMGNNRLLFVKLFNILKRNEMDSTLSDDELSVLLSILFTFDDTLLSEYKPELEAYL